jgi:hypothetical protein
MKHARVEKCGQRGILGRYCVHLHRMGDCPTCIFDGNAIEYGHQRAINIHATHRSVSTFNVVTDVRGAACVECRVSLLFARPASGYPRVL